MKKRFDKLFLLYSQDIYRLVYSYSLSREDSEDIVQKTFYKLYKNLEKLTCSDEEIKRWLMRVAINETKNLFKSSWFKVLKNSKCEEDISQLEKDSLLGLLNNLKADHRITLYLYYFEGYDVNEIALVMKKSVSAIKMRLKRGREELKQKMEGTK